jgi:hypothetical protein
MRKTLADDNIVEVCDLRYLTGMMNGKKLLIEEMISIILKQVPAELKSINLAITTTDYLRIASIAHIMQTSVSIMGISVLLPVLKKMEVFARNKDIVHIKKENQTLNLICRQAFGELKIRNAAKE